ncbi:hypothetical protein D3C72_1881220 [compost metagenome]
MGTIGRYFAEAISGQAGDGEPDEASAGGMRRPPRDRLDQAARRDGYDRVEDWKVKELGLNSRSDIVADRAGNLYAIPRQGSGTPQPLGVRLP